MALFGCTATPVNSVNSWLRRKQLFGTDAGVERHHIAANVQRHDYFFQGGVAGPLPDAVDGALHLARTGLYGRHRIRYRQAQIVVAVGGNDGLGMFAMGAQRDFIEDTRHFAGHIVADGIRQVDGSGARAQHRIDNFHEKFDVGAHGVLGGVFHVGRERTRVGHLLDRLAQAFLAADLQFIVQVDIGSRQKDVQHGPGGVAHGVPGAIDVLRAATRQRRDARPADFLATALTAS